MRQFDGNDPLVSIIVPIYNVEKYIVRCVESIINQTYKNIEVILVDDGSTDNSLTIITTRYLNICTIISKQNGGLSSARNTGLERCSGEYLLFVDSDDWIVPNAVELLVENMLAYKSDICCFRFKTANAKREYLLGNDLKKTIINDEDEIVKNGLLGKDIKTSACSRIYRRSVLKKNNLRFCEGIINEDYVFTAMLLPALKKVSFINKPLYYVEQRFGSISRKYIPSNISIYFTNFRLVQDYYKQHSLYQKYMEYIYAQCSIGVLFSLVNFAYNLPYKDFRLCYQEVVKNNYHSPLFINSLKYKGILYWGLGFLSKLPRIFYFIINSFKIFGLKRYC